MAPSDHATLPPSLRQSGYPSAKATLELGKLIASSTPPDPLFLTNIRSQISVLLRAGAEPNVIVIAYHAGKKTIHRLIDAGPEDDFFEAPYAQVRKQLFEDEGYDAIFNTHPAYSRISHLIVPLFEAAYKLDTDAIFFLSRRGARISDVVSRLQNVNFPVRLLRNPFISASEHGRLEVIDQLLALESFEHPWTQRWLGEALSTALKHPRKFEIAEKLLWHGANLTWTKLPSELTRDIDLMYGYPKLSAALRDQASDLTTAPFRDNRDEPGIQARGFQGVTKLIVSVSSASPAMCQALLNSGADPNAYDSFGMTALMEAIYYGNKEAALLLLSNGADPNHFASGSLHMAGEWTKRNQIAATYQEKKWSATHLAAHRGLTSIITALLEAGAQLDVVDHDGHTPLDLAMQASHHATAFFLLSLDCPFDKNSPDASRLLARAIEECKYHAAEKLIKAGAALPTETWDGDLQTDFGLIQQFYRSSGDRLSLTVLGDALSGDMPDEGYEEPVFRLCERCFKALETGKFEDLPLSVTSSASVCRLCSLQQDCIFPDESELATLRYDERVEGIEPELRMMSEVAVFQHSIRRVPNEWHTALEKLEYLQDDDTGSPAAMHIARHWLNSCLQGHRQCYYRLSTQYFPTRVLDINGLDHGQLPKLVQKAALKEPYVALSHRWGSKSLPSTTMENIGKRLKGIDLDDLTPIMRDAIHIVRSLGYRYIWIDVLCIIQDSSDDWLSEASKMSSVFSGAVLTIAVADAIDHSQGIFRKRLALCTRPFAIPYMQKKHYRDRTQLEGEGEYYVFPRSKLVSAGARSKGTLDTRGWVLQEQLLSTRILYYDNGEIFWDCITVSASESSPISASLLNELDPDETWALKLIRRILAGSTTGDTLRARISDAWLEIIKNYSARDLSHQTDRLIALEGIVEPLKWILREEPIAGMWRGQLWRQLTYWMTAQDAESYSHHPKNTFLAPSWSWLSAHARLYYHNSLLGENPQKETVSHKFTDLQPYYFDMEAVDAQQLPDAKGVTGTMIVTAQSFPYRITANDMKKPVFKRWNKAKLKINTGRWMLDRPVQLPLEVQCLIIAEDTIAKLLVCICVVPDEEQGDRWRRIGLCHWDGLAWQVPSYVGKEPKKRRFMIV